MEFRKNDLVTIKIEDFGSEGEGIGKAEGFPVFVKDAIVGDTVEARIVKCMKSYAYGRLEKVLEPSPFRVEPKCACHRQCGGCQLQALSYDKQLAFKQEKIRNHLIRIGGFPPEYVDARMEPIIGMEEPYHYRNKAQYPIGTDREGNVIAGFYAGRTHSIIPNNRCWLGAEENEAVLDCILSYMRRNRVSAYDETSGTGLVRHVLIRKGFSSGELMVCLVLNLRKRYGSGQFLPNQKELIDSLLQIRGMASVSVSINTERTNVIMGKEIHTLWGSGTIRDTIHVRDMGQEGFTCTGERQALERFKHLEDTSFPYTGERRTGATHGCTVAASYPYMGERRAMESASEWGRAGFPYTGEMLEFMISPLSFYQVNPAQTEILYSLVREYAGLTGREVVWDLYCGIGTISLFLARSAGRVYGVEVIPQAIEDARENAIRNGIANVEFYVGKAEEVLKGGEPGEKGIALPPPNLIVVDPPRKGCDRACLDVMLQARPDKIIYVSCDSATLARDLKILCEGGYEVVKARGVDQFGHTVHVETAVLLTRKDQ